MAAQHKRSKGTVGVETFQDRLRLRLLRQLFAGKQKYLSLGMADTVKNRKLTESKARQIELDILAGYFDASLEKYKPKTCSSRKKPTDLGKDLGEVMTNILAISDEIKTLRQVQEKLGLMLSQDCQFFTEWMVDLPALTDAEQARLDQVRRNYLYQVSDGVLLEETIKMVVLSPLLELAGFYQAPYKFRAEVSVEIEALGDQDEILRGRIDALVLQEQLWIVLIESKKTTFDLELALPQTLAYMGASPNAGQPLYGMVINGSSYLFVKVLDQQYGVSDLFATRSQYRNNLHEVLKILKHLGRLIVG